MFKPFRGLGKWNADLLVERQEQQLWEAITRHPERSLNIFDSNISKAGKAGD